ncbi:MAG: M48 family metallopeptidase [Acidobacteria bacterium]|nr:M48 family metallopeptidase [Acidobacteriota bacterium]
MRRAFVLLAFPLVILSVPFGTAFLDDSPGSGAAAGEGVGIPSVPIETVSMPVGDPGAVEAKQPAVEDDPLPPALMEHALDGVPPDEERMQAYSHGNYILFVVSVAWTIALLLLIVTTGFGGWMQRLVERWTQGPNWKVLSYVVLYTIFVFICSFPLRIYSGFFREKQYGFANQTLPQWLVERGKGLVILIILQALFYLILYMAIRRLGRAWWIAGTAISTAFVILVVAVAPVFIAPLFNTFEPMKDAALRDEILAMAHDQGIPAEEVFEVDASRQSAHNNAYVTGLFGTQRIVLYDTMLENFARREIKFIMGHEMGHYVLNHIWKTIGLLVPLILAGFFIVDRVARRMIASRPSFGIRTLSEPASLPLILLVFNLFILLTSPIMNSVSRVHERQADRFGLEVTGDPAAAASSFLRFGVEDLGEYNVHPVIETLLYSHPSLGRRIRYAQEYAAAHGGGAAPAP